MRNSSRDVISLHEALSGANTKLNEARYFLRLMDRIERKRKPLVEGNDLAQEYSFNLSALLSACYSVVAYISESEMPACSFAATFRKDNPDFYASHHDGGWRTISVHFRPVLPEHDGYIPPSGKKVILRQSIEDGPYTPPHGKLTFDFGEGNKRFYFNQNGPQNSIGDICAMHLGALGRLIEQCRHGVE